MEETLEERVLRLEGEVAVERAARIQAEQRVLHSELLAVLEMPNNRLELIVVEEGGRLVVQRYEVTYHGEDDNHRGDDRNPEAGHEEEVLRNQQPDNDGDVMEEVVGDVEQPVEAAVARDEGGEMEDDPQQERINDAPPSPGGVNDGHGHGHPVSRGVQVGRSAWAPAIRMRRINLLEGLAGRGRRLRRRNRAGRNAPLLRGVVQPAAIPLNHVQGRRPMNDAANQRVREMANFPPPNVNHRRARPAGPRIQGDIQEIEARFLRAVRGFERFANFDRRDP